MRLAPTLSNPELGRKVITKFLCPEDLILLEGLAHMHTQPDRFQGTPLFCTPETPWASHRQFVSNALQPQYAQAPVLLPEAETWMSSLLPPHKYPTGVEFCRFSHCQLFPACFSLSPSSQHASLCHQGHSIRTGWVMAVALSLASLPPVSHSLLLPTGLLVQYKHIPWTCSKPLLAPITFRVESKVRPIPLRTWL